MEPHLELVELPKRAVLAEPGQPAPFAYFPESGLGSTVARSPEGLAIEVGMFGLDGFAPAAAALPMGLTPFEHFMQIGGAGWRIQTGRLQDAMKASASLQQILLRYIGVLAIQTSFTALSNAVHPVDERLARWILMSHDRSDSDDIALTHEFLAVMLAVRRPTVTTSLHVLEGNHFIQAERGYITVINRRGLAEFAGDAYGAPEAEYRRLIVPL